ncbi:aldehyde dehydrogenase family protein [Rhodococcus sp. 14C212]|nr:aldehyde dehydrogenase family protein [Rhodococcus sp. 14C212]NGP09038.1 aldehyde dehydrogenase family protein [Rhodococcus sp. 14C212]
MGGCGREITDPATGALVGRVAEPGVAELNTAVAAAKAARPDWAARGHDERRALLNRAADAAEANTEALAVTVARGCACCGCAGLSG